MSSSGSDSLGPSEGRIGLTVTQGTINTYWERLRRALRHSLYKEFSEDNCRRMADISLTTPINDVIGFFERNFCPTAEFK